MRGAGALDAELRARLREAGLRATASRTLVLSHVLAADGPLSHGELAERLEAAGLDRATVFRNLRDLVNAELLQRIDLGDRVWRFQAARPVHEHLHPHFICTECGDIQCLDDVTVIFKGARKGPLQQPGLLVHVKGRCERCARSR